MILEIDQYLSSPIIINFEHLDSLLSKYPVSDYTVGLKTAFLAYYDNVEEAEQYYISATTTVSKFQKGTYSKMALGTIAFKNQNRTLAEQYLKEALLLDVEKKNKWLRIELYYFYSESDNQKATIYLNQAFTIDPDFHQAIIAKALGYNVKQECSQIISLLNKTDLAYEDFDIHIFLADAYYECNQVEKARESYERSILIFENSDAYNGLATIEQFHYNNLKQAEKYFLKALEIGQDKYTSMIGLGWLYYYDGKDIPADEYFSKAITEAPGPDSYREYIFFLLRIRDLVEAEKLNKDSFNLFGKNSFNQGYEIIIKALQHKRMVDSNELNTYRIQYGEDAVQWVFSIYKRLNT